MRKEEDVVLPVWVVIGILVGWAAIVCCHCHGHKNPWIARLIGIVGGLIGAYLTGMLGGAATDWVSVAIWAWAGAIVLSDLAGMLMGGGD